jgi:alanyl-tRNA synthetase
MLTIPQGGSGQAFLNFFRKHGYKTIPGSSLLDPSVPMAFVMSAGLVQVESSARLHDVQIGPKYALTQNCFRYFDMSLVGSSNAHLSLFRMLGAFTFEMIDRRDIILKIGALLTDVYNIPVESLWATYFSGDHIAGCKFDGDIESRNAWMEIGVKRNHIVGLKGEENFWKQSSSMVGIEHAPKCGPNTEVFYDRGKHLACGKICLPGVCNCGRFVELANILFIIFNIDECSQTVEPLESPFTEAVVGKERMDMVLQNAASVYDISDMQAIINHIDFFSETEKSDRENLKLHKRIIADHIRALLFLTADGAPPPGKGGRARLVRKLIRGLISSQKILKIANSDFLENLVGFCAKKHFGRHADFKKIKSTAFQFVEDERERFDVTLSKGYRKLNQLIENRNRAYINGSEMLKIEKQDGIPIALIEEILKKKDIAHTHRSYQKAHEAWKKSFHA